MRATNHLAERYSSGRATQITRLVVGGVHGELVTNGRRVLTGCRTLSERSIDPYRGIHVAIPDPGARWGHGREGKVGAIG